MRRHGLLLALLTALAVAACGGTTHHTSTVQRRAVPARCAGGYLTTYGCQAHSPTFGLPPVGPPKLTAPSSVPTVVMYDSVTVSALPHGAAGYGGYLFGNFPTFRELAAAFPGARYVPITPQAIPVYPSTARMVCLDVEPFDATAPEAGPWARGELGLGVKPCIYSSLKNGMVEAEQSLAESLGSGWRAKVLLWDADWTGSPRLDNGFDATQWLNHGPEGQNYDQNVVTRSFLGMTTPTPPVDLGGPEHYERYDSTFRRLAGQRMRERNTIMTWDHARCERPARRSVCRSSAAHMGRLLGRDQAVYHRQTRVQRDANRTPGRIQGLSRRLNNGHGVVRRWL